MTATHSRNAPCPCGSGRRFKECHGALGSPTPVADPAGERRSAVLATALAAQRAGDFVAAIAAYRAVLVEAPDHFDATHMLGVVMLQINQLPEAETLIAHAASLRPDVAAVHQNLALVREARKSVVEEESICRSVLPRLAWLCVDPPSVLLDEVGPGEAVEVVFAGSEDDATLAQSIADAAIGRGASVVSGTLALFGPPGWPPADEARLAAIEDVVVIVIGLGTPIGDWPLTARTRSIALVVTHDAPCMLHDQLRALSGQGRRRITLASPDAKLAGASVLPMRTLTEAEGSPNGVEVAAGARPISPARMDVRR